MRVVRCFGITNVINSSMVRKKETNKTNDERTLIEHIMLYILSCVSIILVLLWTLFLVELYPFLLLCSLVLVPFLTIYILVPSRNSIVSRNCCSPHCKFKHRKRFFCWIFRHTPFRQGWRILHEYYKLFAKFAVINLILISTPIRHSKYDTQRNINRKAKPADESKFMNLINGLNRIVNLLNSGNSSGSSVHAFHGSNNSNSQAGCRGAQGSASGSVSVSFLQTRPGTGPGEWCEKKLIFCSVHSIIDLWIFNANIENECDVKQRAAPRQELGRSSSRSRSTGRRRSRSNYWNWS